MDDLEIGQCAVHPDRAGSITCKHCGNFACLECTIDKLWGETLCTACNVRGLARYPLAWDRAADPAAFVHTVRAVVVNTRLLFGAFPDGPVGRAIGFAVTLGALWLVIMCGATAAMHPPSTQRFPMYVLVIAFAITYAAWAFAPGTAFYVAQKVLGGQASLASACGSART
jgi:hypothetical protein